MISTKILNIALGSVLLIIGIQNISKDLYSSVFLIVFGLGLIALSLKIIK